MSEEEEVAHAGGEQDEEDFHDAAEEAGGGEDDDDYAPSAAAAAADDDALFSEDDEEADDAFVDAADGEAAKDLPQDRRGEQQHDAESGANEAAVIGMGTDGMTSQPPVTSSPPSSSLPQLDGTVGVAVAVATKAVDASKTVSTKTVVTTKTVAPPKPKIKYPRSYLAGTLVKKYFAEEDVENKKTKRRLFRGSVKKYDDKKKLYTIVYEDGEKENLKKKEVDHIVDMRHLEFAGCLYHGGTKVTKPFFDNEKGKERPFKGKVMGYAHNMKLYKVLYEDGDKEDLTEAELIPLLVDRGNAYPINAKVTKPFFDDNLKAERPFDGKVDAYDVKSKLYKVTYEDGDSEDLDEKELALIISKNEDGKVEKMKKGWKPTPEKPKKKRKLANDSDDDSDFEEGGDQKIKRPATSAPTAQTSAASTPRTSSNPRRASAGKKIKYADDSEEKINKDHPNDFTPEKNKNKKKVPSAKKGKNRATPKSPANKKAAPAAKHKPPVKTRNSVTPQKSKSTAVSKEVTVMTRKSPAKAKKPASAIKVKKPVAVTKAKKPVAATKAKKPVAATKAKNPISATKAKKPVAATKAKKPVSATKAKKPVAATNAKRPTSATKAKKPTSAKAKKPASVKATKPALTKSKTPPAKPKRQASSAKKNTA